MEENLNLLYKLSQQYPSDDEKRLLLTEKLIALSIDNLKASNATLEENPEKLEFKLYDIIIDFIQKINLRVLETYNKSTPHTESELSLFAKCIDLINDPFIKKTFEKNIEKLEEMKILAYNNLSCIHRKQGNFQWALKSVSFALKLEKIKLNAEPDKIDTVKNIISTCMNQAVIYSELKSHDNAIKILNTVEKHLEKLENLLKDQESSENHQEDYQSYRYLKMVCLFNLAVENEYIYNQENAKGYYEEALELAKGLKNIDIIKKSENALTKINKKKRIKI